MVVRSPLWCHAALHSPNYCNHPKIIENLCNQLAIIANIIKAIKDIAMGSVLPPIDKCGKQAYGLFQIQHSGNDVDF